MSARPAPTSCGSRWASPTCWSTWCSRGPSGGAPESWRSRWKSAGGLDAYTGRDAPATRPRPRRGPASRLRWTFSPTWSAGRCSARAISSPSGTSCSKRSTASPTRRTISSSSSTPRRCGRRIRTATRSSAPDTLAGLSAGDLRCLHQTGYYRGNCVIAAAGNLDHDRLLEALAAAGSRTPPGNGPAPPLRRLRPSAVRDAVEERDTAQTHIVFGTDTFPLRDPRRFAISILTNVFGGGMSSRLFQRVREELGSPTPSSPTRTSTRARGSWGCTSAPRRRASRRWTPSARSTTGSRARIAAGRARNRQAPAQGSDHAGAGEPGSAHGPAGRASACDDRTGRWTACSRRSTR